MGIPSQGQSATERPRAPTCRGLRSPPVLWIGKLFVLWCSIARARSCVCYGIQLAAVHYVKHSVSGNRGGVNSAPHIHFPDDLFYLAGLKYDHIAVLVALINLSVRNERRSPYGRQHVVDPIGLPGLRIQTVEKPAEVRDIQQAVKDCGCGD